jgi:hypothetical protein
MNKKLDSDIIAEIHEGNGTDPFDDPAFLAALEREEYVPISGAQWEPAWVLLAREEAAAKTRKS